MSAVMERAKQHRIKQLAGSAERKKLDADVTAAYDELRERAYRVSMPDYDGTDSHGKIEEDREALVEYLADSGY